MGLCYEVFYQGFDFGIEIQRCMINSDQLGNGFYSYFGSRLLQTLNRFSNLGKEFFFSQMKSPHTFLFLLFFNKRSNQGSNFWILIQTIICYADLCSDGFVRQTLPGLFQFLNHSSNLGKYALMTNLQCSV